MASCMRCHRPLSDPVSIGRGYGPECWSIVNGYDKKAKEVSNLALIPDDPNAPRDILYRRLLDGRIETNVKHVIVKHSPTGFEWGYCGSGPADFALNILIRFLPPEKAILLYQDFKFKFIAGLKEAGRIEAEAIDAWIAERTTKNANK